MAIIVKPKPINKNTKVYLVKPYRDVDGKPKQKNIKCYGHYLDLLKKDKNFLEKLKKETMFDEVVQEGNLDLSVRYSLGYLLIENEFHKMKINSFIRNRLKPYPYDLFQQFKKKFYDWNLKYPTFFKFREDLATSGYLISLNDLIVKYKNDLFMFLRQIVQKQLKESSFLIVRYSPLPINNNSNILIVDDDNGISLTYKIFYTNQLINVLKSVQDYQNIFKVNRVYYPLDFLEPTKYSIIKSFGNKGVGVLQEIHWWDLEQHVKDVVNQTSLNKYKKLGENYSLILDVHDFKINNAKYHLYFVIYIDSKVRSNIIKLKFKEDQKEFQQAFFNEWDEQAKNKIRELAANVYKAKDVNYVENEAMQYMRLAGMTMFVTDTIENINVEAIANYFKTPKYIVRLKESLEKIEKNSETIPITPKTIETIIFFNFLFWYMTKIVALDFFKTTNNTAAISVINSLVLSPQTEDMSQWVVYYPKELDGAIQIVNQKLGLKILSNLKLPLWYIRKRISNELQFPSEKKEKSDNS